MTALSARRFAISALTIALVASVPLRALSADSPAQQGVPADSADALVNAALGALRQADADRTGALWDNASSLLKTRLPRAAFVKNTASSVQARGPVKLREWTVLARLDAKAGQSLPEGNYVNVEFKTHLANGTTTPELVSFAREQGAWRLTGIVWTPQAVAGATPAAAPTQPVAVPTGEVETAVHAWAAAWSSKDTDKYLAAYAPDFTPARGQTRQAWETDRRKRIEEKSRINVSVDDLVVSLNGPSASARFKQVYAADAIKQSNRKTLELQRIGGRWLIRKERTDA